MLANQLPTIGGVLFFGRRFEVLCVWVVLRLKQTYEVHSGYCFGGAPDALWITCAEGTAQHDFHHSHSFYSSKKYRFVTMGAFALVWDRLFGTHRHVADWWAANPHGIQRGKDAPVEAEVEGKKLD